MKRVIAAVALSALAIPFAATAQDDQKGAEAKSQTQASAAVTTRHDHAAVHKQGAPASMAAEPKGDAKKPLHDHARMHKQQ